MLRKEVNRWKFNHELDKISCNVNIKPKLYIPYTHRGTIHYTHRGTVHYTYRGTVHYTHRGTSTIHTGGPSTIHTGGPSTIHTGGLSTIHTGGPSTIHTGGPSTIPTGDRPLYIQGDRPLYIQGDRPLYIQGTVHNRWDFRDDSTEFILARFSNCKLISVLAKSFNKPRFYSWQKIFVKLGIVIFKGFYVVFTVSSFVGSPVYLDLPGF